MTKKRRNQTVAPVTVEHSTEEVVTAVVNEQITTQEQDKEEAEIITPPLPPNEEEADTTEVAPVEEDKGYRVIRTDKIQNLSVGEKYKREDKKNCKIWTVVHKEDGKILVSSSPKNTHNPRKEADLEVVVIELT
mgnify:CR=1 FL=1